MKKIAFTILLSLLYVTNVFSQAQPLYNKLQKLLDVSVSLPSTGQILSYNGTTNKWNNATETDPKVGTLTNTKWCYTDGNQVICTQDAPAGTGDITAVGDVATGDAFTGTAGNTLTFKGATSGTIAFKPTAVAGINTITMPAETGTVVTSATTLAGDVTGTSGATAVGDDSHAHTTTTISGIDISADTNLAVTAPIVLTDDTLSLTVAKDIVAGVGLSGGEDNVLPGTDADTTLTFAPSELESVTWGGGAAATIVHTFDVSGTDTTMTMGSATTTFSGTLAASNLSGSNTGDNTIATTGDSATSFFSTGTLEFGIGGTGLSSWTQYLIPYAATTTSIGQIPIGTSGQVLTSGGAGLAPEFKAAAGGTQSKSFIITNPTSSADGAVWRAPAALTIIAIHGVQIGGTNIVGMLTECDSNGLNPVVVDSSDMTITTSNVNDDGTLSNPSIDSGDYVGWATTSVSGAVSRAVITFEYTIP